MIQEERLQRTVSLKIAGVYAVLMVPLNLFFPFYAPSMWHNPGLYILVLALCGMVGSLSGWLVGILFSPVGNQEKGTLRLSGAISAFLSGFVFSKADRFLDNFEMKAPKHMIEVGYTLMCFLLALVVTFNTRHSLRPEKVPEAR